MLTKKQKEVIKLLKVGYKITNRMWSVKYNVVNNFGNIEQTLTVKTFNPLIRKGIIQQSGTDIISGTNHKLYIYSLTELGKSIEL